MPKENLTALKTLVFSMGLLLIGGTVLLAGLVWKKLSSPEASRHAPPICAGGTIDLRGKGAIMDATVHGSILYVTSKPQGQQVEIWMVDPCKASVTGHLTLQGDGFESRK